MKARRLRLLLGWGLFLFALGATGGLILFTRYMLYDDEGYVLWSVRSFIDGHRLYDEVFSQYGPLLYLGYQLLHFVFGTVFDSDSARLITLGYWLATSLLAGACARALTGRDLAGVTSTALVFLVLINNSAEPFHPGSLLALVTAGAAWIGLHAIQRDREYTLPPSVALLGAAAALIKINVGGFILLALFSWMVANSRAQASSAGAALRALVVVAAAMLPLLLMGRSLHDPEILRFAMVAGGCLLGLSLLILRSAQPLFGGRAWGRALLIPILVGGAVSAAILFQGTSMPALFEGVVSGPLRHPGIYNLSPRFPTIAVLLLASALSLVALGFRRPALLFQGRSRLALAAFEMAPLVAFLANGFDPAAGLNPDRFAFYFGPALCLPLCLAPDRNASDRAARWLAWLFGWQLLQAYPVAGSQIAWASFLWVPLAVHGFFRGLETLSLRLPSIRPEPGRIAAIGITGLAILGTARIGLLGLEWWHDGDSLGFPGARWLHPESRQAEDLAKVRRNLLVYADTVFSFPGMFSFNIWTGKPTPTQANVTHWFSLLDEPRQRAIIDRLDHDPRAMIVVSPGHLDFLENNGFTPRGLLVDYLKKQFQPTINAGAYQLWSRRDRIAPTALDSFVITSGGSLEAVTETLPAPVAAVLLRDLQNPSAPPVAVRGGSYWSTAPLAGTPSLQRHHIVLPPITDRVFSVRMELALLDGENHVMAVCAYDPLHQKLSGAAPRATD